MSAPDYDWRGKRTLSIRTRNIAFLLELLEGSYERENSLASLGIKGAAENYRSKCQDILKLIDELRPLFLKMHADGLPNLVD